MHAHVNEQIAAGLNSTWSLIQGAKHFVMPRMHKVLAEAAKLRKVTAVPP